MRKPKPKTPKTPKPDPRRLPIDPEELRPSGPRRAVTIRQPAKVKTTPRRPPYRGQSTG